MRWSVHNGTHLTMPAYIVVRDGERFHAKKLRPGEPVPAYSVLGVCDSVEAAKAVCEKDATEVGGAYDEQLGSRAS